MYRWPSASHRYAPCARTMKRGVPPTARNARTGELTPPGITRCARAKSCALRSPAASPSVDMARALGGACRLGVLGRLFLAFFAFLAGRQRPEEAIGDDVAHAGTKARVECLVEEGECLADGRMQFCAGCEQRGQRRRQSL